MERKHLEVIRKLYYSTTCLNPCLKEIYRKLMRAETDKQLMQGLKEVENSEQLTFFKPF